MNLWRIRRRVLIREEAEVAHDFEVVVLRVHLNHLTLIIHQVVFVGV